MKTISTLKLQIRQLPWWWHNKVRSFFIRQADLGLSLRTGIELQFREWADWSVFSDVFVEGDYDTVIQETIATAATDATLNVLDIGANVGFFTLRFLHLCRRQRPDLKCQIHQFEANPSTLAELRTRMERLNLDPERERIITHSGAVGKRSGCLWISPAPCHSMSAGHLGEGCGLQVCFIDLEKVLENVFPIHLLKCDIEGSEALLIENYGPLLKRTQRSVFEFHPFCSDRAKCLNSLEEYGLERKRVIASNQHTSLEYFLNRETGIRCTNAVPGR